MADKYKRVKRSMLNRGRVLDFSFQPAGAGAPTNLQSAGFHVASVARTGVGVFLVTFSGQMIPPAAVIPQVGLGTLTNLIVQAGAFANQGQPVGTATLVLTVMAGATGTATDIAAASGNTIFCKVILDPTTVRPA